MPAATALTEPATLFEVLDRTWPAAEMRHQAGWTLRLGPGGKRVSAASRDRPEAQVAEAELAMRAAGQRPLFVIRPGEEALDAELAARGYALVDPVLLRAAPVARIAESPPLRVLVGGFALGLAAEIWAAGGIGPARLAVMARAPGPKAYLLGRDGDDPAGVGFVAAAGGVAMLHAVEVLAAHRRRGVGRALTRAAAAWAAEQGAGILTLAVTRANSAANAVYEGLGMDEAGAYHYRQAPG